MLLRTFFFALAFLLFVTAFVLFVRKFINPYKLIMIFGKKGSGKTTLLTKLAWKYCKSGRQVYVNTPLEFVHENLHYYDPKEIGRKVFPPEAVAFVDEVGMIFDNRKYKEFRDDQRDYFKLQRHYRNTVYLFSQSFDVDKKLRDLTDYMYLCTCHMNVFSVARRIRRTIIVTAASGESESRIADNLEFIPLWLQLFGVKAFLFTYIPKWAKKFNSHVIDLDKPYFE